MQRPNLTIAIHGRPGTGKTLDAINAFGSDALYVTLDPSDFIVANTPLNTTGKKVRDLKVMTFPPTYRLSQLRKKLRTAYEAGRLDRFEALVINSWTDLSANEFTLINKLAQSDESEITEGYGGREKELGKRTHNFVSWLKTLGLDVVILGHENNGYSNVKGKEKRGGFKVNGQAANQALFELSDVFVRKVLANVERLELADEATDLLEPILGERFVYAMVDDAQDYEWWSKSRIPFHEGWPVLISDPKQTFNTPHGGGVSYLVNTWEELYV